MVELRDTTVERGVPFAVHILVNLHDLEYIHVPNTLFLGDINTGTWFSRLGESQMRQ
jgi:hypothetical protein